MFLRQQGNKHWWCKGHQPVTLRYGLHNAAFLPLSLYLSFSGVESAMQLSLMTKAGMQRTRWCTVWRHICVPAELVVWHKCKSFSVCWQDEKTQSLPFSWFSCWSLPLGVTLVNMLASSLSGPPLCVFLPLCWKYLYQFTPSPPSVVMFLSPWQTMTQGRLRRVRCSADGGNLLILLKKNLSVSHQETPHIHYARPLRTWWLPFIFPKTLDIISSFGPCIFLFTPSICHLFFKLSFSPIEIKKIKQGLERVCEVRLCRTLYQLASLQHVPQTPTGPCSSSASVHFEDYLYFTS